MRKNLLVAVLTAGIVCGGVGSAQEQQQSETGHRRPKVGLALGGGGALGLTEIGVLRWFEENHIPVDSIAGTSMGSMLAALYATGKTPDEISRLMNEEALTAVFRLSQDFRSQSYRRREDRRWNPNALTVGLKHGVSLRSGVLTDAGLNSFLSAQMLAYGSKTDFSDLPIPFRCVATDIINGKQAIFRKGSLADAVRASVSIPGVYPPAEMDGHVYVDGALLENLPTGTLQNELHPDVILAVSIPLAPMEKPDSASILGVLQRSFSVASWGNELLSRKLAQVVIQPDVAGFTSGDYMKVKDLEERGYASAEAQRTALLQYRLDDAAWAEYLRDRRSRVRNDAGLLRHVAVDAKPEKTRREMEKALNDLPKKPVDAKKIDEKLEEIEADGRYTASYSIDVPAGTDPSARPQADLKVVARDKTTGPPFLYLGGNVIAQSGGFSRATVDSTLVFQDLGGYGSEARARIRFGSITEFNGEYYKRLTSGGAFIAPQFEFLRMPVYMYNLQQDRVAQRLSQRVGGGVDAGYTFKRSSEVRVGWREWVQRWRTDTGTDTRPDLSGTVQWAGVKYRIDDQDRALIARHGLRGQVSAGYLYNAVGGANAPRFEMTGSYATTMGQKNTLAFGVEGGTMLNRNVSDPFRFTLGGPFRLSSSIVDEFRGTDYFLVRPSYMRRIASLPQPLGQNIYILAMYEAGQMRSPTLQTITRQDGFFGLAAETPLGVITIGPAIGDAGHRKVIFTLGRFF
jgi:NTE family protein